MPQDSTWQVQAHNHRRIMPALKDVATLASCRIKYTPKYPVEILLGEGDVLLLLRAVNLYLHHRGDYAVAKGPKREDDGPPITMREMKQLLDAILNSQPGTLSPFRSVKEVL